MCRLFLILGLADSSTVEDLRSRRGVFLWREDSSDPSRFDLLVLFWGKSAALQNCAALSEIGVSGNVGVWRRNILRTFGRVPLATAYSF